MAINWQTSCDSGTDGENMICEVLQEGINEIYAQNETIITNQAGIQSDVQTYGTILDNGFISIDEIGTSLLDNANHISFYIFIAIVFYVVFIISRWLFNLIKDLVLGW